MSPAGKLSDGRHRTVTSDALRPQPRELRGGLETQLLLEQAPAELILPKGFAAVSLSQMHEDYCPVCALTQRLSGHGGKACVDRAVITAAARERTTQRLEGVEAGLPEPLALDHDRIVVPVGQEFSGSHERVDVLIDPPLDALRQPMRDRRCLMKIHLDAGRE